MPSEEEGGGGCSKDMLADLGCAVVGAALTVNQALAINAVAAIRFTDLLVTTLAKLLSRTAASGELVRTRRTILLFVPDALSGWTVDTSGIR